MKMKRKNPNHKVKQITETETSEDAHSVEASNVCFAAYTAETNVDCISIPEPQHTNSEASFFTSLNAEHKKTVTLANGQNLLTAGIGEVFVRSSVDDSDQLIQMTEVLHVPDLCGNLISVKKLTARGFEVCFRGNHCVISKEGKISAGATEHSGLHKLDLPLGVPDSALHTSDRKQSECIHVWHNRLGY